MAGDRETGLPQPRGRPGPLQTYCSTDPLADRGWPEIPGRPALQTPEKVSSDFQKFHVCVKIEPTCPLYRPPSCAFLRRSLPEDGVDSELGL